MNLDFVAPLFVPGDRPERFSKAAASGADAIIIDLEDAVAPEAKNEARLSISSGFTDLPVIVRINGRLSPWHEEDVSAVKGRGFAGVMVPKAESAASLTEIHRQTGLPVLALVETALGIARARRIARTDGVARLAFGSIDFCADLGCEHNRDALLLARLEMVLASRLAGIIAPLDGVTTSIRDEQEIVSDAVYAQGLGFAGKLCIHPAQIASILQGFRPSAKDIDWARRVLESSSGATLIDGNMVDEPVRAKARSILSRSGG